MQAKDLLDKLASSPKRTQWLLFVLVFTVSLLSELFGESSRELLRYESSLLSQYEFWRLITAHFIHLGWSHFTLNMLGFFALWVIYGGVYSVKSWLFILFLSALGISLFLIQFDQNLTWYVGLSGVLHAILAAVLVKLLLVSSCLNKDCFHWEEILLLIILIFKLIYEQLVGAIPFSEPTSGGPVVVNAHFYGAIMGCICSVFLFKFTNTDTTQY